MITTLLFDFSRVLLHPKDTNYKGGLNELNRELLAKNSDYNFFDYFVINQELLDFLESIKNIVSINIFTKGVVQNRPEVKAKIHSIFTKVFSANDLGLEKTDPHAFLFVCKELHKNPREVAFIDDTVANIEAASSAGLETIHYVSNEQLITKLKEIL